MSPPASSSRPHDKASAPHVLLRVLEPGLHTLLVDFGRPGCRSLGVPVGGAADRSALALGNALVGNPANTPALEMSLAGPTVRADGELACVAYGAPFAIASDRRPQGTLATGTTFTLSHGEELRLGSTSRGMRAYLCVRGGLFGQAVLGSQSALEPLRAGAALRCVPGRIHARSIRPNFAGGHAPDTIRVIAGPQAEWFAMEKFLAQKFAVTPASNRMGLRLHGEPLDLPGRELHSEPVCPGSVQVTSDGQCIILGVDGQTIGGYPKIAQVVSADLDTIGQLRPGEAVRFVCVSLEEAQALHQQKQAEINEWVLRLAATMPSSV